MKHRPVISGVRALAAICSHQGNENKALTEGLLSDGLPQCWSAQIPGSMSPQKTPNRGVGGGRIQT